MKRFCYFKVIYLEMQIHFLTLRHAGTIPATTLAPLSVQQARTNISQVSAMTSYRKWPEGRLSFGGGVGQVLGKTRPLSSSKRISEFWGRNVHLWWVTRVMVCACMCWYGQSVTSGCRSLPFLSVFLLRGCDWPQGRMDHNMVSFFEKCERLLRFCATNYSVLSLEEKSCQRSQRLAGDQSFDASQRVASSFFASLCDRPHAEHWAFCVRNILLNVDIHTSADYSNQF